MKMKRLIAAAAGVVLAAGLTARTASAGAQTAAFLLDTRADILAEILPEGSADYSLEADDPTLTVKFLSSGVGSYVLPYGMGPLAFDLNGQTVSGTNGVNGTTTTAGGDGGPVFQVGGEITIRIIGTPGSGSISGGNGGDGTPAGKGAYAFIDAAGAEVKVSDPCGLVKTGADGEWLISVGDVVVKAIAVGDTVVTQTVAVTFTSEITLPAFADWIEDKLKVKSSADLATLDKAEAETPTPVGQAKLSDDRRMVTTDLEVDKPSEATGFFRVVVP